VRRLPWIVLAAALAAGSLPVRAMAQTGTPPPAEADLPQCYAWAKEQSESLHMQAEQVYQLEQQYKQALAGALPNLSFNASDKWQKTGGGTYFTSQPQVNFSLFQPLFSGLREYAAMAAFKHQGQAAELQIKRAQALLFQDVSSAFYLVVSLEAQLGNAHMALDLTTSRIKELKRFENLGRSRHSEVVLVESQEASLIAEEESLKGQIAVARELLSFLTGKEIGQTKLLDKLERLHSVDPEERILARAYDRNDVLALRKQLDAQKDQLRLAKGAWLPTVGFSGNYYLKRMPSLEPVKWDAGLAAGIPLFAGGGQLAAVREAQSQVSQAQYNFELGLRQARSQIHSAYMTLRAAVSSADAAEKAYLKADESYRLDSQEYRLGLVTNLDVLQALNSMLNAKTIFDTDVVQTKLDLLRLKVASEELP
jgi:outer membrane protein TolC